MDEPAVTTAPERPGPTWVGPRHVCARGCQFVVDGEPLLQGGRFAFVLGDSVRIAGTVRWVVRDRAGFAFDAPIRKDALSALRARTQRYRSIDLHPA